MSGVRREQMWFAALHVPPAWLSRLLGRILEGSADVLALLGENPFPERTPRYVRALIYEYRIADLRAGRETGVWWVRDGGAVYFPPSKLVDPPERDGRTAA